MVFVEEMPLGRNIKLPPEVREAFARENERMERIRVFWAEHKAELLERYPDQFVAADVETGEVVDTDTDFLTLHRRLTAMGFPRDDRVAVEFMRTNPYVAW